MGDHDAPTLVDFIRNETGLQKISFIAHSTGTTQLFYALTKKPEFWKERLNLFVALSPVTRMENSKSEFL